MDNTNTSATRTAVIIGASSGIGEAVARRLSRDNWRIALLARRTELLARIAAEIGKGTYTRRFDISEPEDAQETFRDMIGELGLVDLIVISSGTGSLHGDLNWESDRATIEVNVFGFMAVAQAATRYFIQQGRGHLVGITSVAALRGFGPSAAYCASKAYQSTYLAGLRDLVKSKGLPITITEIQPGFVDTAMMKTDRPLSPFIRRLIVASPEKAADQIAAAISRRVKHAYIPRRYALIAAILKCLPRPG